jgi:hypothetical protein
MFRCNHNHQGAPFSSLPKLQLLKSSIKIHRCGQFGSVAAYIYSVVWMHICSHTTELTTPMYFN